MKPSRRDVGVRPAVWIDLSGMEISGSGAIGDPYVLGESKPEILTSGSYEYILLPDGTVEIVKCTETPTQLEIPDQLDGRIVTRIGDRAFARCYMESVVIPDSVTAIGEGAFADCVFLSEMVVSPEHPAFAVVDGALFSKADKRLISYPSRLEVTSYSVPQGTEIIGNSAFSGCYSLSSITIPDSVVSIGANPFRSCSLSGGISISANHPLFAVVDGVLFSKPDHRLICYPDALPEETYAIPQGTEIIGESAFADHPFLKSITIPEGVTCIEASAFAYCQYLTAINLPENMEPIVDYELYAGGVIVANFPDSITSIGDYAFSNYTGGGDLPASVTPNGTPGIGKNSFYQCSSLTDITLPDGLTSIGDNAFEHCFRLSSMILPQGVTRIGDWAFADCDSLTNLTIPDTVTSIEEDTFSYCSNLTLTVGQDSYAEAFAVQNGIPYVYAQPNASPSNWQSIAP